MAGESSGKMISHGSCGWHLKVPTLWSSAVPIVFAAVFYLTFLIHCTTTSTIANPTPTPSPPQVTVIPQTAEVSRGEKIRVKCIVPSSYNDTEIWLGDRQLDVGPPTGGTGTKTFSVRTVVNETSHLKELTCRSHADGQNVTSEPIIVRVRFLPLDVTATCKWSPENHEYIVAITGRSNPIPDCSDFRRLIFNGSAIRNGEKIPCECPDHDTSGNETEFKTMYYIKWIKTNEFPEEIQAFWQHADNGDLNGTVTCLPPGPPTSDEVTYEAQTEDTEELNSPGVIIQPLMQLLFLATLTFFIIIVPL